MNQVAVSEEITQEELDQLKDALVPLLGVQLDVLKIPRVVLQNFEPSQVGSIAGNLMDACIPQLSELLPENDKLADLGLRRTIGMIGDREGYPDYTHLSGKRVELKLLYVDPVDIIMKRPKTRREASARLTQKVTIKNVDPKQDALLVLAYQLRPDSDDPNLYSLTIIDIGVFSMIGCILARDTRLHQSGGMWFGNFDTPVVLSNLGKSKLRLGIPLDKSAYGRQENEGKDYNEDTNFGKLARIPYPPLTTFLRKHGTKAAKL